MDTSTYCDYQGSPGCPLDYSFAVTGFPPNTPIGFGATVNGVGTYDGCACVTTNASGDFLFAGTEAETFLAPVLITPGETATVVVTVGSELDGGSYVSGTYTLNAPAAPAPVVSVSLFDSAEGCGFPGSTGCPLDILFTASGFPPNTNLPVTCTFNGTDITDVEPGGGTTVTTNALGDVGVPGSGGEDEKVVVGDTPIDVPFAGGGSGTIVVTFGGVSDTYSIANYGPY